MLFHHSYPQALFVHFKIEFHPNKTGMEVKLFVKKRGRVDKLSHKLLLIPLKNSRLSIKDCFCNGCSPCVSQRKFYTAQFVLSSYKICPDTSFMQFAFVTVYPLCCTYRCITNSVCNYWLILVFSTINLNWIATDDTIRDLFMYTSSIR